MKESNLTEKQLKELAQLQEQKALLERLLAQQRHVCVCAFVACICVWHMCVFAVCVVFVACGFVVCSVATCNVVLNVVCDVCSV